ncbi:MULTISPECIES: competence protein ComK [Bacillaceae]|uniref:competence protein ComK n=1 Tax=Bacillaceae TaxID=186817 RepID=UPI001BDEB5A5|nr:MULTISPECIES: competence protein ComK [Bacillaceae]MDX8361285.1 competence protein ComK [Cytobacillus sp. IB215316]
MNDGSHGVLQGYEVNRHTMSILPHIYEGRPVSKVIEETEEFIVLMKPLQIVERSCFYYGTSFRGRREGTYKIIGISYKAPIAIEPSNMIYLFPTLSPKKSLCAWISHPHVQDHKPVAGNKTDVIFVNKTNIELPISHRSFKNQLHRTAQLQTKLTDRIDNNNRKMAFLLTPEKKNGQKSSHSYIMEDKSKHD